MKTVNNSPFYFYVCFDGISPQQKNSTRALCQGNSPNFICSHVPMEIFLFYQMRKRQGNKKRVVLRKGEVPILMNFPKV
jgi:hypothetical protein